ncbi:MAG: DUF6443 domain-containing protein, partial [Bacteroidota bacterium]
MMKKHIQILLLCLGVWGSAIAQTPDGTQNYVRSTTARVEMASEATFNGFRDYGTKEDKVERIQYFDGLGRPIQTIDWESSPSGQDIITFHKYDALGREPVAYLPFTGAKDGSFTDIITAQGEQAAFYLQTGAGYAATPLPRIVTQFESSPLSRMLEQGAPGAAWQPEANSVGTQGINEHTVLQSYETNTQPIKAMKTLTSGIISPSTYPVASLRLTISTDENGIISKIYTDKLGRILLTQTQVTKGGSEYATTAYAYDEWGRVKYVIQPEGWKLVEQANSNFVQATLDDFAFQYTYDKRGRVIEKKVPGADWVYMVYDLRDRLVLTQDGNQRAQTTPEWSCTIYDALDRPIITGIYASSTTRAGLQTAFNISGLGLYESKSNTSWTDATGLTVEGYTNQSYLAATTNALTVHSVTYYDDYDFDHDGVLSGHETPFDEPQIPNFLSKIDDRTTGMATGIKLRVLNRDVDMPDWLWTVTFYDEYGREIQTANSNHLYRHPVTGEGKVNNYVSYEYNFAGEMLRSVERHDGGGFNSAGDPVLYKYYTYDHRGRLLKEKQKEKDGSYEEIVHMDYNELGTLLSEKLGPSSEGALPLQKVDYQYNERGWLTGINNEDETFCNEPDIIPPAPPQDLSISTQAIYDGTNILFYLPNMSFQFTGDDGWGNGKVAYVEIYSSQDADIKNRVNEGTCLDHNPSGGCKTLRLEADFSGNSFILNPEETFEGSVFIQLASSSAPYYFTLRAFDEAGNASPFSDVAKIIASPTATSIVYLDEEPFPYTIPDCGECVDEIFVGADFVSPSLTINLTPSTDLLGNKNLLCDFTLDLNLKVFDRSIGQEVSIPDATPISRSVAFPNDPEFAHSNPDFTGLPASITLNLNGSYPLAQDAANSNNSYANLKADVYAQITQHLSGNSNLQTAHIEQVQFWVWRSFRDHFNQIFGSGANYDLFSVRLIYNEGMESIDPNSQGQYNGNISGMLWENPTSCTKKGYAYQYDGLNRLTQATYGEKATTQSNWSQHAGRYNASYTYDLNGNILSLTRQGKIANGYGSMDVLTYTYAGNQLTRVSDAGDNSFQTMHQFLDGNTSGTDYQYDASGNMIDDMNKGIDVMYNHLNKPTLVQKGTQIIQYIYSTDGTKLRQKVTTSEPLPGQSAVSKITDYVNGYEYEDSDGGGSASSKELVHIMHTKGRMVYDATHDSYTYEYFLKDHLGNTRVVFSDQNQDGRINPDPLNGTDIRQIVEGYYPFGAQHNTDQSIVISPENQYLYNGKELQDELNLGWYDYGARMYDPTVGRWNGVDELAELYLESSTFTYVINNPISYIDPDGRQSIPANESNHFASTFVGPDGNIIEHRDDGDNNIYLVENVEEWRESGGSKDGLPIVGREVPGREYQPGSPYYALNKSDNLDGIYPQGGGLTPVYPVESALIPIPFLNYFGRTLAFIWVKIGGKYVTGQVVKVGGKWFLRVTGQSAAKSSMSGKSLAQLREMVGGDNAAKLRQLFGTSEKGAQAVLDNIDNVKIPQGLSQET